MKSIYQGIVLLSVCALSACATTSGTCNMDNKVYVDNYKIALEKGYSEQTALKLAKYNCQAYEVGQWANE